eukprot:375889_1
MMFQFRNLCNDTSCRKFFNDREKITTQFKSLSKYTSSISSADRKQFHLKNYRRAFNVCRHALDEYTKRYVTINSHEKYQHYIKRACEIIGTFIRLSQDIPHLIKQRWNHNA